MGMKYECCWHRFVVPVETAPLSLHLVAAIDNLILPQERKIHYLKKIITFNYLMA